MYRKVTGYLADSASSAQHGRIDKSTPDIMGLPSLFTNFGGGQPHLLDTRRTRRCPH
jgi:hypothetical protein